MSPFRSTGVHRRSRVRGVKPFCARARHGSKFRFVDRIGPGTRLIPLSRPAVNGLVALSSEGFANMTSRPFIPRVFHRALNCAAAFSLVLCFIVCMVWARSYWADEVITSNTPGQRLIIDAPRGAICVTRIRYASGFPNDGLSQEAFRLFHQSLPPETLATDCDGQRGMIGFYTNASPVEAYSTPTDILQEPAKPPVIGHMRNVLVPCWFVVSITTWPLWRRSTWARRRRRMQPGHCASCGYDLRATPDRCPECGVAVV